MPGQRLEYGGAVRPARQHSRPREGGSTQSRRRLFARLEQEEQRLKKHDGRWMDIQQSLLVRQPFFKESRKSVENSIHPICHYF